ncbi:MAG TPA: DUF2344 domain-containing protein [Natronincola sp.]|nr:DUF2344 domain-containing protein [Natronincola sp.]
MGKVIRFQFTKGSEVRFLSHLDLLRTMERALRRAKLPMAYSEGFSPRPVMAFGFALPVGVLSEAEYGDFEFSEIFDPQEFMTIYNKHLPKGLKVVEAERLPEGASSLMKKINTAKYEVLLPNKEAKELESRWQFLRGQDTFFVQRETKRGVRELDILPFLYDVSLQGSRHDGVIIECVCALGNEGNLRIEELGALLNFNPKEVIITRTGQLIKMNNHYGLPMGNRGLKWKES